MNIKKKILTLLLSSALLVGALAGCGNPAVSSGSGSAAATGSGEKVKIQYWHINGENQGGAAVQEFIDEFNASQDRIEVEAPTTTATMSC